MGLCVTCACSLGTKGTWRGWKQRSQRPKCGKGGCERDRPRQTERAGFSLPILEEGPRDERQLIGERGSQ